MALKDALKFVAPSLREPEFKIPDKRRDEYKWEEWGTLVEVKSAKKSVILGTVFHMYIFRPV